MLRSIYDCETSYRISFKIKLLMSLETSFDYAQTICKIVLLNDVKFRGIYLPARGGI